jgi:hypothetical protein
MSKNKNSSLTQIIGPRPLIPITRDDGVPGARGFRASGWDDGDDAR